MPTSGQSVGRVKSTCCQPIHYAAACDLLSIVKYYILECGLPVDGPPGKKRGMTPLHCAAACPFYDEEESILPTIEWLVEQEASLTMNISLRPN